jgi:hypothetical protein
VSSKAEAFGLGRSRSVSPHLARLDFPFSLRIDPVEAPQLISDAVKETAELPKGPAMIHPVLQVADVWPSTPRARRGHSAVGAVLDATASIRCTLCSPPTSPISSRTDITLRHGSIFHLLDIMCSNT